MKKIDSTVVAIRLRDSLLSLIENIPGMVEEVFGPRVVVKQVFLATGLHCSIMVFIGIYDLLLKMWNHNVSGLGQKLFKIEKEMRASTNYKDWLRLANKHDELSGLMAWRKRDKSSLFDAPTMRRKIAQVKYLVEKNDPTATMFRLRGALMRDQYGVQHEELYNHAKGGTKKCIVDYNDCIENALQYLCDCDESVVPDSDKLAYFSEMRHSFGRTALLLSGGAYLGYYHMGIFKSLWCRGMLPRVVSGASAGSLMAAIVGTKTDEQLNEVFMNHEANNELDPYRRDYFKFVSKIKSPFGHALQASLPAGIRWLLNPLLMLFFDGKLFALDIDHLSRVVRDNVGDYTFQEAFDRTGRIINITVAPLSDYDPPRVLNYLTAPHVCVWSAAVASCAIPSVFDPIQLVVKAPDGVNVHLPRALMESGPDSRLARGYSDGSIENDLPMDHISETFNVNHFIVSQVNPHSALFSSLSLRGDAYRRSLFLRVLVSFTHFLKEQCRSWLKSAWDFGLSFSNRSHWVLKRGLFSTITQKYEGGPNDITISPWRGHISSVTAWTMLIKNPTDEEYREVINASEQAVWPYLPRIQARCRIEAALDKCTRKIRERIAAKTRGHSAPSSGQPIDGESPHLQGSGRATVAGTSINRTPSFNTSREMLASL